MTLEKRTISWSSEVREMAEEMAFDGRFKRGVSELIERLILAERKRKRGTAHLVSPITKTYRSGRRKAGRVAA